MRAAAILVALTTFAIPTASSAAPWEPMGPDPIATGPFTGRISAVAPSASDPDLLYVAGATGGVWRLDAAGWTPLTDHLPTTAIGALAVDPFDDEVIYAGSGEANYAHHSFYGLGIYKSVDRGATWTVLAAETFAGRTFSRLVVSPGDTDVLFAAVMHAGGFPARSSARGHPDADGPVGVFRSDDAGATWTQLAGGLPAVAASDLALDPTDPSTLYAAVGDPFGAPENGIYRSTDGGTSWTKLAGGLPQTGLGRVALALAPSQPQRLYALLARTIESPTGASTVNAYRSDDGGDSWLPTGLGEGLQGTIGWYVSVASVSPNDADAPYFGGISLARSLNAGTSFADITPPHVDIQALGWDAAGSLVVGDDGGVHRSADGGSSWTHLNDGLGVVQFYPGISRSPGDGGLIGGTQDNGTNVRVDGSWVQVLGADGGPTALHPDAAEIVLAQYQGTGNLFRSVSGGTGLAPAMAGIAVGDRNAFFCPVAFARDDQNVAWYATHRVYRSDDAGASWTAVSADITGGAPTAIRALEPGPAGSNVLWAVTNAGVVLRSEDAGATFEATFGEAVAWARTTRELAADPTDAATAVLALGRFGPDRVLLTEDAGAAWTSATGDLPDTPALSAAIARAGELRWIFVGTDAGVFHTCNDGASWDPLGEGLPNAPVVDVMLESDALVAATMGRGAWRVSLADLPSECPVDGDTDDGTGPPGETMALADLPPPATTLPMTTVEPPDDPSTTSDTEPTSTRGGASSSNGCGCTTPTHEPALAWLLLLLARPRRATSGAPRTTRSSSRRACSTCRSTRTSSRRPWPRRRPSPWPPWPPSRPPRPAWRPSSPCRRRSPS